LEVRIIPVPTLVHFQVGISSLSEKIVMQTTKPIDLATADLANSPVLGAGLWGRVLDLGDDTVVKLAKRESAGIGDGLLKFQMECQVLQKLQGRSPCGALLFPQVVGSGERVNTDYPLWLHMTKVPGRARKVAEIRALSESVLSSIGDAIGRAASAMHKALARGTGGVRLPVPEETFATVQEGVQGDMRALEYLRELRQAFTALHLKEFSPIHGDFNISNLLFEGEEVVAVIDFAETRRGFFEEDLASNITELPCLKASVISAFEAASGHRIDAARLEFSLAMQAFFTYVICGRLQEYEASIAARKSLDTYLG
jgi:aminoglycoside phosphotransferase